MTLNVSVVSLVFELTPSEFNESTFQQHAESVFGCVSPTCTMTITYAITATRNASACGDIDDGPVGAEAW